MGLSNYNVINSLFLRNIAYRDLSPSTVRLSYTVGEGSPLPSPCICGRPCEEIRRFPLIQIIFFEKIRFRQINKMLRKNQISSRDNYCMSSNVRPRVNAAARVRRKILADSFRQYLINRGPRKTCLVGVAYGDTFAISYSLLAISSFLLSAKTKRADLSRDLFVIRERTAQTVGII